MILEYQKNIHCGCEVQELQSILGALLAGYPETLKQGSKEPELVRNGEVSDEELKTCLKSLLRREDFSVPWDLPGSPAKAAALATSGAVARRSRAERREDSQDLDLVNATVAELLEKLQVKLRGEQQGNKEPSARFLLEDEIPHLQDLLTLCEDFIRWQRFVSHRNGENPELPEPFCSFQHFPAHVRQVLQKVDSTGFEEMPEIPQRWADVLFECLKPLQVSFDAEPFSDLLEDLQKEQPSNTGNWRGEVFARQAPDLINNDASDEDDWQRALRSANLFKFTSRRAEHVHEWNETSTGKLDPSAFGYPQDAHMTCNNRIALMRRLLKSDSEEENEEGHDRIDDEE
ncbi:unnamed protein product [Cladocopium goreaui]|uniref:Uncharacterized protein n=1 Tax=Cladocopium goreaui TaxID=2562237 RepID=A0A9P1M5J1_9DINO|nr:unnamed protein product [Cladocopium goreaui]